MELTEQIQLADGEVLRHLLLHVRDCVLNVEANDLADWQLASDGLVGQQREALEEKLVLVVLDDRRRFREEVRRR